MSDESAPVNDHPFLTEFFATYLKMLDASMAALFEDEETTMKIALDPVFRAEYQKNLSASQNEALQPLAEKAFLHHDKDHSGVLSVEESELFFKNYVEELKKFMLGTTRTSMTHTLEQVGKQISQQIQSGDVEAGKQEKMLRKLIVGTFATLGEKISSIMEAIHADYLKNKSEHDKAAFDVVDTAKDGCLHKEEVMRALEVGSELNKTLLTALGFGETQITVRMAPVMQEVITDMMMGVMAALEDEDDE
eukprot:CAMPEP_0178994582 /NCGR_PEP_ID=MMETSP0795-20121207/7350_1 /TAXON_ID=88552 /ORGANISM="Amoebophrya sp., Strain Ameob2" /LENGTH=248 /DNA_ID=CAMNT_0020686791 /DNA_START=302 /DNA_END=1048 /DNA_ORIENTATION=-